MSKLRITGAVAAVAALGGAALLGGCGGTAGEKQSSGAGAGGAGGTVTLRLWDEQAAAAYEKALPAFEKAKGVDVNVEVVPWADYWTGLRNDIASGDAPDVFWTNASNYSDYADAGKLLNIDEAIPADQRAGWLADAVTQYTWKGTLWGVPAITDPGIAVLYNKALLADAGVTVDEVEKLAWDPAADTDTLRQVATKLTKDSAGKTPADAGFDPQKMVQFGYNAALDTQAMYLNFLGSNGAQYQDDQGKLTFDSPEGVAAFQYLVNLINKDHVAPSAADTNDNGDFSRDQFLQGKMALFQTGSYNLANVADGADFEWGIAPLPAGPKGRVSVVNSIVAAGSADSTNPEGQKLLLEWIGSAEAGQAFGETGVALPANTDAQETWTAYWSGKGIDVSPMLEVLADGTSKSPFGPKIQGGMEAYSKVLKEVFLGRTPVAEGVAEAQKAANTVISGG